MKINLLLLILLSILALILLAANIMTCLTTKEFRERHLWGDIDCISTVIVDILLIISISGYILFNIEIFV